MSKKRNNYILSLVNPQRLFFVLAALFVFLVGSYMYLVSATVMHVVLQAELRQEAKAVLSEVSELENRYIIAQHKVSSDIASLQGFTPVTRKVFIDRTPASLVLSESSRTQ